MSWVLLVDAVVAVLLAITIAYAVILNRKIGILHRDRDQLEKVAAGFQQATTRAEDSIAHLKVSTDDLQERMAKVQELRDDLIYLIERGETIAESLENKVRAARKRTAGANVRPFSSNLRSATATAGDADLKSEDERELLKALAANR